jgi:predicted RNA-binding protein with EMAP domain
MKVDYFSCVWFIATFPTLGSAFVLGVWKDSKVPTQILDKVSSGDAARVASEYFDLIESLSRQSQDLRKSIQTLKETAQELQQLELMYPKASSWAMGDVSPDLKAALAEAKAADNVYGPHSDQAYWKWRNVEDAVMGRLDVNCVDGELATNRSASTTPNVRYLMNALDSHHHDYSAVVDAGSIREVVDALGMIEHFDRLLGIEVERMNMKAQA